MRYLLSLVCVLALACSASAQTACICGPNCPCGPDCNCAVDDTAMVAHFDNDAVAALAITKAMQDFRKASVVKMPRETAIQDQAPQVQYVTICGPNGCQQAQIVNGQVQYTLQPQQQYYQAQPQYYQVLSGGCANGSCGVGGQVIMGGGSCANGNCGGGGRGLFRR